MKRYPLRMHICIVALLAVLLSSSFADAAPSIRIAVINTTKDEALTHLSEIVASNFTGTLAKSNAVTLVERAELNLVMKEQKINAARLHDSEAAKIGNLVGCQYILLSSLVYYASPIINARIIEVSTSTIVYAESENLEADDNSSMIAASSRIADEVLEVLAGEQAVITEVHDNEVIINRGSSHGVRNGDLYRVFMGTKRNTVNVAVIRVKEAGVGFSTCATVKNGGYIEALRKSDKVEAVSQGEANALIKGKKFMKKRIGDKEAANPTLSALNALYEEPNKEYHAFLERCFQSSDVIRKKFHAVIQQDPQTQQPVLTTNDGKVLNEIGEDYLGLGMAHLKHSRNNTFYTALMNLESIEIGLSFSPKEYADRYAKSDEELANEYIKLAKLWFELAARRGDLDAINNLGVLYSDGLGVEKDYKKAFDYYSQAAAKDDPTAMLNLGITYSMGWGVKEDDAKAFELISKAVSGLISKAASKNQAVAVLHLGMMYHQGEGVKQDYAKAIELYRKAADMGDPDGLALLGTMYSGGLGVPQDFRMAIKLYRQAIAQGSETALGFLKQIGAN